MKLLWVAAENDPSGYISGFDPEGRPISLVLTIKRHGDRFEAFLGALLTRLANGETMPSAWVKLAPQWSRAPEHAALPETIYSAGGGQLRLH